MVLLRRDIWEQQVILPAKRTGINMVINGYTTKFKLHPRGDGFDDWEIDDGYWLSMRASGWAYRSYYGQRIGWKSKMVIYTTITGINTVGMCTPWVLNG
jgi:hypothetical protein